MNCNALKNFLCSKRAIRLGVLLSILYLLHTCLNFGVQNKPQSGSSSTLFVVSKEELKVDQSPVPVNYGKNDSTVTTTTTNKNTQQPQQQHLLPVNRLTHETQFGLGHRLIKASSAYHLAKELNLTKMKHRWGTCGGKDVDHNNKTIFPYLFQTNEWDIIPTSNINTKNPPKRGVDILVRNDVYGYFAGQSYKDFRIPLPKSYKDPKGPFLQKTASDVEFYTLLESRFVFMDKIKEFQKQHSWDDHFVLGLHLRAGNGEQAHFAGAKRSIANETEFVDNLMKLVLETFSNNNLASNNNTKPLLLFLATDTPYLVPRIQQATQRLDIPTVLLPQIRVEDHQGVTFSVLQEGTKCLLAWQAMVSDMILLAHSDVLIAARQSTFTQSMPLSLVMNRHGNTAGPHFCEVSSNATTMTCFQDLPTWLFRENSEKQWHFGTTTSAAATAVNDCVYHKLIVHFPDVEPPKEYLQVVEILNGPEPEKIHVHEHGKRFNPKYRGKMEFVRDFSVSSS